MTVRGERTTALHDRAVTADVRRLAVAGLVAIAVVATLGTAYAEAKEGGRLESGLIRSLPLGLNNEWTLAAFFSGALLAAAALVAYLTAATSRSRPEAWLLRGLALLFTFMAADEIFAIHERLESLTGVGWITLYSPLIAVGGVGWLLALRSMRPLPGAAAAFVAGGLAWAVSQALERMQYDDDGVLVRRWSILPEEVLEMTGSLLFGLALLALLQHRSTAAATTPAPRRARR